jgi:AcrR family transcriptional regulator
MARTRASIGFGRVVAAMGTLDDGDDSGTTTAVLDAAAELLGQHGLRRWSIDDVADRAGVGRTSVYRRFANRDDLVHAVLARELRETLAAVDAAARGCDTLEDKIVEGGMVAFEALRESLVERLLRIDPTTFLPFLTTDAGPLVAIARQIISAGAQQAGLAAEPAHLEEIAEVAARLGLSFVLTRDTVLPIGDRDAFRASVRRLLQPVVASLSADGHAA